MAKLNSDSSRSLGRNMFNISDGHPTVLTRPKFTASFSYDAGTEELTFDVGTIAANQFTSLQVQVQDEDLKTVPARMNVATPANLVISTATLNKAQNYTVTLQAVPKEVGLATVTPFFTVNAALDWAQDISYDTNPKIPS